ncbi:helix-turn-helix domain-containing protein [Larkinella rosea]|uniref:helix-turn-helix domain-containing protein n=1 Tax=Larkinella rosea TaxID=2025312 RepID=UPI00163B1FE3|nr:helix-turn-helix transcriptional regulator [Larkinella rosea]
MANIYENIRSFRAEKGLTQEDMAEKLGINQGSYARLERGETELTLKRLDQIAAIFEVDGTQIIQKGENLLEEDPRLLVAKIHSLQKENERLKAQIKELELEGSEDISSYQKKISDLDKDLKHLKGINKILDDRILEKDKLILEKTQMIEILMSLAKK